MEKVKVAILNRRKSGFISLLNDLKKSGISKHEVFFYWDDLWLAEQHNEYDFLLIHNCFFDLLKKDIASYHLFDKYKFKIIFYYDISYNVETENGYLLINFYTIFFRPFKNFGQVIKKSGYSKDNYTVTGIRNKVQKMDLEKNNAIGPKDSFFLKSGHTLIKFCLSEVLCMESDRNYVTVYLRNEKHLIRQTLHSLLEILPDNYIQINRSVIVNINKIQKIVGNRIHMHGLHNFSPTISDKYKLSLLNAVPLFNETGII
ncbi:MAG: LytTR family DNA-binding domain-containing protein [Flavobacteriaceae bacterium]